MNLTENEGRVLFSGYGIGVPRGFTVPGTAGFDGFDAKLKRDLRVFLERAPDVKKFALKAQLRSGKRGKSGGIVFADEKDIAEKAKKLFEKSINHEKAREILAAEALDIAKEYFLSIAVDRFKRCPVLIFSTEGGIDIEETAEKCPGKISKIYLRQKDFLPEKEFAAALSGLGVKDIVASEIIGIALNLFKLFNAEDCLLAEINPLILAKDKKLYAADAKITIDDNANYRHGGNLELAEKNLSKLEKEAAKFGLSYVELDGDLAVIGNGAGLVMATLDAVRDFGASPANFCDAGGGATREMIEKALETVLQKKTVKAVFINIFGGITRCDLVAEGVSDYFKKNKFSLPITVRMVGTNDLEGRNILKTAGIKSYSDFEEAAKTAAESVKS